MDAPVVWQGSSAGVLSKTSNGHWYEVMALSLGAGWRKIKRLQGLSQFSFSVQFHHTGQGI